MSSRARCSSSAATRSSKPAGGASELTATTFVSLTPSERSAALRSRRERSATWPEVGLRDDEHVGDLHDPRLQELQDVAAAGLHHDRDGIGHLGHLGLGLTDADGLDDDDVERRGERVGGGARRGGEAAEPPAGGHRADEDALVARVDDDPRAVAEQRAARALGGRIDGEHRDAAPARAPRRDEVRQQRRLAGARAVPSRRRRAPAPRRRARRGRRRAAARRSRRGAPARGSRRG